MRSVRSVLVVPTAILALFAGACGDAGDQPDTTRAELADEVEYVAGLLDEGRNCAALEAVRVLDVMADRSDDDQARAAIDGFTTGVRDTVACDPDDEDDSDDEGGDDGGGGGEGGGDESGGNQGNDKPPPGRGRGRGQGN